MTMSPLPIIKLLCHPLRKIGLFRILAQLSNRVPSYLHKLTPGSLIVQLPE